MPVRTSSPHLNIILFGTTLLTVTYTGWLLSGEGPEIGSLGELLLSLVRFFRPEPILSGLPYTLCILGILGTHEFGHYLACRYYRIPATLPFFIPGIPPFGTFGAVIRIRGAIPHRKALFDIAAAGPIAGFLVALPILVLGVLLADPVTEAAPLAGGIFLGDSVLARLVRSAVAGDVGLSVGPIYIAAWFGMLVTSMNLFPVGQLDGGHLAYALSRRLHRAASWTTITSLAAFVVYHGVTVLDPSVYTLWCLVLLWMRDRHPRVVLEDVPLGTGRRLLAVFLLLLFALTFIPVPIVI
jgi:membrane-associated protease RseP (regulator of RpoE activity)